MTKIHAIFNNEKYSNLSHLRGTDDHPGITVNFIGIYDNLKNAGFIPQMIGSSNVMFRSETVGIYVVSVAKDADWWSGTDPTGPDRHILYEIPEGIIDAAKRKKIIIVIDNQSEGRAMRYKDFDGFKEMHRAMHNLNLPKFSVLLINGDAKFEENYEQWRHEFREPEKIAHVYFCTWPWIFYDNNLTPEYPLVLTAIEIQESREFNSLNRTPKAHRVEHLYFLIKNNLMTRGIVSGHWANTYSVEKYLMHSPLFTDVDRHTYSETLWPHLPAEADGPWIEKDPDQSPHHIFNHEIYKGSLLTVVTESHFIERSVFLTEKTFKPIAAGHPFLMLGPWKSLEVLREMGYRTDFFMIDDSYDNIISNTERFNAVNEELKKWCQRTREEKEHIIKTSMETILHNQNVFRQRNHINEAYDALYKKVEYILTTAN